LQPGRQHGAVLERKLVKIPNQKSKASPALAAHGNQLHLVHLGETSDNIWYSLNDGSWRPNVQLQSAVSFGVPGLASSGRLQMVYATRSRELLQLDRP